MHELGIVTYVAKSVTRIAEEKKIRKVAAVVLEIGEVSGLGKNNHPSGPCGQIERAGQLGGMEADIDVAPHIF